MGEDYRKGMVAPLPDHDMIEMMTRLTQASDSYLLAKCLMPFRFSSKYWDSDIKTYAYQLRDYGPEIARWLSRDPIGEEGGANVYSFVGNSPINGLDPIGLRENDPPSHVSAPCCGGKIYDQNQSCCHENKVVPVVAESSTHYKVCCRRVRYNMDKDPFYGLYVYHHLWHCEIRSGACYPDEKSYDISKTSTGLMDNAKPCRCANRRDLSACLDRNPKSNGAGTWGDNCQANTVIRMAKCCLGSNWKPSFYGYPIGGE